MDPLRVGHVIGVNGDTVEIQITTENLIINYHGTEYRIGRLGSYVTIPIAKKILVGYVVRVGAAGELEPLPMATAPRRITMTVLLLGTVENDKFRRGVAEYPTLGENVRLGVDEDFELIFGSFEDLAEGDRAKSFSMGKFAVDTSFEVRVLGKEFFAKHIAVMGNSGSGKSVTTAKIIHEALKLPHTQIVLFDMHGEYVHAFSDDNGNPNPNVTYLSDRSLVLPYWMLRFEEFEQLFVETSNKLNVNSQIIFLRSAFEKLKRSAALELDLSHDYSIDTPIYYSLEKLKTYAQNMNDARFVLGSENYAFSRLPYRSLPLAEQEAMLLTQRMEFNSGNAEGEIPHATYYGKLLGLINLLESRLEDRRYDFLLHPFEQVRNNPELQGRLTPDSSPGVLSKAVAHVIRQMLGGVDGGKNLTIIDLSGLPFEMVDITVAVLTRTLFDYNFWSPADQRQPVALVFEEAHNYLFREADGRRTFARTAVEKVAKEGRKYGVSAMIVSQRPSEISETVLSQCNTMILMRMNNPNDQEYAGRVVSDQFRDLINVLPSMRPGEGYIIGDAVMMPMRTLIDMPPKLPKSGDVDFFRLWGQSDRRADTDAVLDRWWRQDREALNAGREPNATITKSPQPDKPARAPHDPNAPAQPGPRIKPSAQQKPISPAQKKLAELAALVNRSPDS